MVIIVYRLEVSKELVFQDSTRWQAPEVYRECVGASKMNNASQEECYPDSLFFLNAKTQLLHLLTHLGKVWRLGLSN